MAELQLYLVLILGVLYVRNHAYMSTICRSSRYTGKSILHAVGRTLSGLHLYFS